MAKIKITEKERNSYISNKSFLEHVSIHAIRARDDKTLKLLNSRCSSSNSFIKIKPNDLFKELIPLVANDKHEKIVKLIINKGNIDLSQQRDSENATLLDQAACYGATKIVKILLAKGFDPNNQNSYGQTSLHRAVTVNSLETVKLLIKHHTINLNKHPETDLLNIPDQDGNTPLHLSIFHKDYLILTTLRNAGAKQNVENKRGYTYLELYKALTKGRAEVAMPNLQPPEKQENSKFYAGMTSFYKGILSDRNQVEFFVRAINSIKTFLDELSVSSSAKDFAYESLWALAKSYEYYKYKDSEDNNKLQKYIINKAWGDALQFESDLPYPLAELLKNWDSAHLQNNVIKNEEIIAYLASPPKEPRCSTSTQELDFFALSLQGEKVQALGVFGNDESDV
ncbi:MAG: hypothetical protein DMENIID0002_12260 [Rickettsia endosymbiont of Sergentomyia squamirostris]|uniref:Ankyrin repeat protein n=1 Tax=Candidatus Tisiphia endosymbiont of Sergentomyia squamirostris TaxID=3113639 RepID=A0AAT9G9Q3_9RICK